MEWVFKGPQWEHKNTKIVKAYTEEEILKKRMKFVRTKTSQPFSRRIDIDSKIHKRRYNLKSSSQSTIITHKHYVLSICCQVYFVT